MARRYDEPTRLVEVPVSLVPLIEQFVAQGGVGCPFFDTAVPAGFPSPAQDENPRTLDIVSYLIPYPERTILVKVPDDAFEEEGIFCGDILIAERETAARDGDLALCSIEGNVVLTRIDRAVMRQRTPDAVVHAIVRFRIHTLYGGDFI